MQFSTSIFGEYSTPSTIHYITPLTFYVLNLCYSGFMLFFLWRYVGNPGNKVSDGSLTPEIARAAKTRAVVISSVFALMIPVAFINAWAARYVPLLIPLVLRLASWENYPVGSNFGAFLSVAENAIPSTHRNFRHASWGHLQCVENSEVLFGYFLFKEKVTDAPALQRVASLLTTT
jgi:hypothetical protein